MVATLTKVRLEAAVAPQIGDYQAGFRKRRGTTDHTFISKEALTTHLLVDQRKFEIQ